METVCSFSFLCIKEKCTALADLHLFNKITQFGLSDRQKRTDKLNLAKSNSVIFLDDFFLEQNTDEVFTEIDLDLTAVALFLRQGKFISLIHKLLLHRC